MVTKFVSVLRQPDFTYGATENSPFRFEEKTTATNDVKFEYVVDKNSARVIVYPSGSPVKFLKLRFCGDMRHVQSVYGDQWERGGVENTLEWRSVCADRHLPWFCYAKAEYAIACYGVKTCPDAFVSWQVDPHGVTLFINLLSGNNGTDLKAPIVACEVVELVSNEGEDAFFVAKRFAKIMCDKPIAVKSPIFGVNNWYWAYGQISRESVKQETDQIVRLCSGVKNRPYMIIDDGWQLNRTFGKGAYIGGPWLPNAKFGSMQATAEDIHSKGAKAGIWFRPLLRIGDIPEEAKHEVTAGGVTLDVTHPYTLEQVESDAKTIKSWGYDLIKHDFTTFDILGWGNINHGFINGKLTSSNRVCFDKTITMATAIKNLYKAIQRGAGDADVIGCNTISHLTAGIHSCYRVGGDTSGRSFEWTRSNGINSMMRLPLNESFYLVDPDCACFTERVDKALNLDFLEMCAITGVTTLASITPNILTDKEEERINAIYRIADENTRRYSIKHYDRNVNPEIFVSSDGKTEKEYDWESAYDGTRSIISWLN